MKKEIIYKGQKKMSNFDIRNVLLILVLFLTIINRFLNYYSMILKQSVTGVRNIKYSVIGRIKLLSEKSRTTLFNI